MNSTEIIKTDYVYFNIKTNKLHFFNIKKSKEPILIINSNMKTDELIEDISEDTNVLLFENDRLYHSNLLLAIMNEKFDNIIGIGHILGDNIKIIKTSKGIFILDVKKRIKIKL